MCWFWVNWIFQNDDIDDAKLNSLTGLLCFCPCWYYACNEIIMFVLGLYNRPIVCAESIWNDVGNSISTFSSSIVILKLLLVLPSFVDNTLISIFCFYRLDCWMLISAQFKKISSRSSREVPVNSSASSLFTQLHLHVCVNFCDIIYVCLVCTYIVWVCSVSYVIFLLQISEIKWK